MVDSNDDVSTGTEDVLRKRRSGDQRKWNTLAFFEDNKLVLMKFNNDQVHHQSDVRQVDYIDENRNYGTEEKIEDMNRNQTNANGSKKYFNDFSDYNNSFKVKHKLKNEYLELAATKNEETTLQKYYRLKFETEELLQEISFQKEKITNEKLYTDIGFQIKYIFGKLMNYRIKGFSEQYNGLKIFETSFVENCINNELLDKLLHNDCKEGVHYTTSQIKNIQITPRPNNKNIDQFLQISKIEECFQKLVKIVGYEKSVLKSLGYNDNNGLLEDIELLQKLSKFNLPQVNAVESRSINLLPKLKKITSSLNYQYIETDSKINQIYEFISKGRRESHLLFNVLQRMAMLEVISHKAESFSITIDNLKTQYSETSKLLKYNEKLLSNITTHVSKNVENVFFNLYSLNGRVEVIADQLKNEI